MPEILEQRIAPATFTVLNLNDAGPDSLREAINAANATPNQGGLADAIAFNIAGQGPFIIQPLSPLPDIAEAVIIDGYSQPGTQMNTDPFGTNAQLLIQLDGSQQGTTGQGLVLGGTGGSTVKGLAIYGVTNAINGSGSAIYLQSDDNVVAGNFLGTDVTGSIALGNADSGVRVQDRFGSTVFTGNVIGGFDPEDRNLLSGNLFGVALSQESTGTLVAGNLIGTDATGLNALGNSRRGVTVSGDGNFIGAPLFGGGNVIAANGEEGVGLFGNSNVVQANIIGLAADGVTPLPNDDYGIGVESASGNVIGGAGFGEGNVISGNASGGINLGGPEGARADNTAIMGNLIGTDISGFGVAGNGGPGIRIGDGSSFTTVGGIGAGQGNVIAFNAGAGVFVDFGIGNAISGSAIFDNGGLGIELSDSRGGGVTPNDPLDADNGPNGLQNFPVFATFANTGSAIALTGTLPSKANTNFRVEFFAVSKAQLDPTRHGEGAFFLGSTNVTTDAAGDAPFTFNQSIALPPDTYFTATATEIAAGNTSEFSDAIGPAGVFTWIGGVSTDYLDPQNWSPNGVPGLFDTAIFDATALNDLELNQLQAVGSFQHLAGNFIGTGELQVFDGLTWSGGTQAGPALTLLDSAVGTIGGATVLWDGNGVLSNAGSLTVNGAGAIFNFGSLIQTGALFLDAGLTDADGVNSPAIVINTGAITKRGAGSFGFQGIALVNDGAVFSTAGALALFNYTTPDAPFDFVPSGANFLDLAGGDASATNGFALTSGLISGAGQLIGDVFVQGGTVSPGGPGAIGALAVVGNYDQLDAVFPQPGPAAAAGGLAIEFAATNPGEFDTLTVTGTATTNGVLFLDGLNGFQPPLFTQVEIVNAASRTGTMSEISSLPNTFVQYTPTSVFLSTPPLNTYIWDGSDSADWFDGNNWSGGVVPGPNDLGILPQTALPNQPDISGQNATIGLFEQQGGTLSGAGSLTVNFQFLWTGGSQTGAGLTIIADGSAFLVDGAGTKSLDSRPLRIDPGAVGTIDGTGGFAIGNDSSIDVSGRVAIVGDVDFISGTGVGAIFVGPGGSLAKTAGGATDVASTISVQNAGDLRVDAGTLNFAGNLAQSAGQTVIASGATLGSTPGFTLDGGALRGQGALAGSVNQNGGTIAPGDAPVITLGVDEINGGNGTVINGIGTYDQTGRSVSILGDVNGDGFADFIVGAPGIEGDSYSSGGAYVIFGTGGNLGPNFDLATLDGTNGFRLLGSGFNSRTGYAVADAGDFNGDGFADIILGASRYNAGYAYNAGAAYIVFGRASFPATVSLASLDGTGGVKLPGISDYDYTGGSVSGAGDFNGDGFDDVIIGARGVGSMVGNAGAAYVVFGRSASSATIDLGALNGNDGFVINGAMGNDRAGTSVGGGGDFNGDGFDDVLVGAPYGNFNSYADAYQGAAYVVFGRPGSAALSTFSLSAIDGSNGVNLRGAVGNAAFGDSVSFAGDLNGDGLDDVAAGAPRTGGRAAFVVFGSNAILPALIDVAGLDGSNGFRIDGLEVILDLPNIPLAAAGDVNGDGIDDLIAGSPGTGSYAGAAYVIFGAGTFPSAISAPALDGTNGFAIVASASGQTVGVAVGGGADLNGDGFADVLVGTAIGDAGAALVIHGSSNARIGALTIDGNLNQGSTGSLAIELGGTTAGTGYDQLIVTGTAAIGGTLNASLVNGFSTGFSDQFDVLTATGGISGTFGFENVPPELTTTYSASTVSLVNNSGPLTYIWDAGGGLDTSWFEPLNWNFDAGFPGAGDTAILNIAATINLPGDASVGTFQQANGLSNFTMPAGVTFTVVDSFDWLSGTQGGAGTTVVSGALNILAGGGKSLGDGGNVSRTLVNNGTATLASGVSLQVGSSGGAAPGAQFINNGVFNATDAFLQPNAFGGTAGQFTNAAGGVLNKAGAGALHVNVVFNNAGIVNVDAGTLQLAAGGASTGGIFAVDAGAVLQNLGGLYTVDAASTFGGAGSLVVSSGTVDTDAFSFTGPVSLGGGTLDLNALNVTVGTLDQILGTITGSGTLTVSGLLTLGAIASQTGSGTTIAKGGVNIGGSFSLGDGSTASRTFINNGTANFSGAMNIAGNSGPGPGSQFINNGVFNATDGSPVNGDGSLKGLFTNAAGGVFNKSGAGTTTFFQGLTFNNSGTVNVDSGTVHLNSVAGASTGGMWAVDAGAQLTLQGGSYTVDAASTFGGAGALLINGNLNAGAFGFTGPVTLTGSGIFDLNALSPAIALTQTGGTLTGSGTVTIPGLFNWSAGTQGGTGTTIANGGVNITGPVLLGTGGNTGRTFISNGAATLTGTLNILASGGAAAGANFINNGVVDAPGNSQVSGNAGAGNIGRFTNAVTGTFNKTGAGTTTSFGNNIALDNAGLLNLTSGTLDLPSGTFTQTAGATVLGGGALSSGPLLTFEGGELRGVGTITGNLINNGAIIRPGGQGAAGTITITGEYTQGAGGTLAAELGGTGAGQFDVLAAGGNATLGGTLDIANIGGFTPATGQQFRVVTSPNNPGTFATLTGATTGIAQQADGAGLVLNVTALTYIWDAGGGADQSWFNPLNWNFDSGVPGAGDSAVLGINATINLDMPATVGSFTQSNGSVAGVSDFTVLTSYSWSAGTLSGPATLHIPGGSTLTLSGGAAKVLDRRFIDNQGTITVTGTGPFQFQNGPAITNAGLFDFQSDADFVALDGVGATLTNAGTLQKSAGAAVTIIGGGATPFLTFNNSGDIAVDNGTLELRGLGGAFSSGATLTSAAGATLDFASGAYSFTGFSSISGAGTLRVSGATIDVATFSLFAPAPETLFVLAGGTLTGDGDMTFDGSATFSGGTLSGAGTTFVTTAGTLTFSGNAGKLIDGRYLVNDGTVNVTGTGDVQLANDAQIDNTGLWDFQSDADINAQDAVVKVFNNFPGATVRKSGGAADSIISEGNGSLGFGNFGVFDVRTGSLSVNGGGVFSNATVSIAAGATANFGGGNMTFSGTQTLTGAGTLSITTGGTLTLLANGTLNVPAPITFTLGAGTLTGPGNLVINGLMNWANGTMSGTGTTTIQPGATLTMDALFAHVLDQRTLENRGTAILTNLGALRLDNGAVFNNRGLFDLQSDASLTSNDATAKTFHNFNGATFRKSVATGTSTSFASTGIAFLNEGAVDVQTGTLNFGLNSTWTDATGAAAAGATLIFTGNLGVNGAVTFSGAGTTSLGLSSTTTINTGATLTGAAGGTLSLDVAANVSGPGTFVIAGNTTLAGASSMTGSGVTNIATTGVVTVLGESSLNQRTLNNAGAVNQTGVDYRLENGAAINNSGQWNLVNDSSDFTALSGGGTFNNLAGGTLQRSGAGTSTAAATVPVTNAGTISSLGGNLNFNGGFTQTAGSLVLNGGDVAAPVFSLSGGELSGAGAVGGTVSNLGAVLRPGGAGAIGTIAVSGVYTQSAVASLEMELAGTGAGQFDVLSVGGTAMLSGALNVTLLGGFTPPNGSQYQVVTSNNPRFGTFAPENLPPGFAAQYNQNDVTLLAPAVANPLIVTTTADTINANDGVTSLREAILFANSNPGLDTITFNVPGAGVHTIQPGSALPDLTDSVIIDGYSQPGSSVNTLAMGTNAVLNIVLNGTLVGGGGLRIVAAGSTVRGLVVNGFGQGIFVNAGGTTIEGNFIGTNASGTTAVANAMGGIVILNGTGSTIGGFLPEARNLISGNRGVGVLIMSLGIGNNLIAGNLIGTDSTGEGALGNAGDGLGILESSGNIIGGTAPGSANVISANRDAGIRVFAGGNVMQGNLIGVSTSGAPLGNLLDGISIEGLASDNRVGGTSPGEGNIIAFNGQVGVAINTFGNQSAGTRIQGNSIFSNASFGIALGQDGVTPNDPNDTDTGPNGFQNYPVLATPTTTNISGTLNSTPSSTFVVDFFANTAPDPSGFGEGEIYLGSAMVTTNASGDAAFSFAPSVSLSPGVFITATATSAIDGTSEFSQAVAVPAPTIFVWDGSEGDQDWFNPANWDVNAVPGASSIAILNIASVINLAADASVGSFQQSDGVVTSATGVTFSVLDSFDWTGGLQTGTGTTRVLDTGVLTVSGAGAKTLSARTLISDFTATLSGADLGLAGGMFVNNGSFTASGGAGFLDAGGGGSFANAALGTFNKTGAGTTTTFGGAIAVTNAGTVNVSSGTLAFGAAASFTQTAGSTSLGGGSITVPTLALQGGTLTGAGTITGGVSNTGGAVQPGGAGIAGTLTITGNYTQGAAGTLAAELGGVNPGQFDVLAIGGAAALGGTLNATTLGGFTVSAGSRFSIVTANPGTGTFAPENLPPGVTAQYNANDVTLLGPAGLDPLVVTTTADTFDPQDGVTSLREAIIFANGDAARDTISFNIPGAGIQTITLGSALPNITNALVIDGFTQPGSTANTGAAADNAVRNIVIVGGGNFGLSVQADNSIIRGLALTGFLGAAIEIDAQNATVTGNDIRGNSDDGIVVFGGGAIIGGAAAADRNLIHGNGGAGIAVFGGGGSILGNFIGIGADGATADGNAGSGIILQNSAPAIIGGIAPGAGNVIAFNRGDGVTLASGDGSASGIAIRGNSIFSNTGLGIDLEGDGVSTNDPGDGDSGENGLQNFPVIGTALPASIAGTLNSSAGAVFTIDFYANAAADPSGFGEGRTYLGSTSVTTNASGDATFNFTPGAMPAVGSFISATATSAGGDTSEFSRAVVVAAPMVFVWDGSEGDQDWFNPANWDVNAVPGASDVAILSIALTINLTADADVGSFTQSAGTFTGPAMFTVINSFTWTGGTQSGAGVTIAELGGVFGISGGAPKMLDRDLLALGTTTWSGTGDILAGQGAAFSNQGPLDIQSDVSFLAGAGAGATFENQGAITKSGGAGATTIATAFDNDGAVNVNSGRMNFSGGGAGSGALAIGAGATADFAGGAHAFDGASSIGGAGTLVFSAGSAEIGGGYTVSGPAQITGGMANFNVAANIPSLSLSAGALGGTGAVTITGNLDWTGGEQNGAGTTTIASGATLDIAGLGVKTLGRTLNNDGAATWTGTGSITTGLSGAAINNTGSFAIQPDSTFAFTGNFTNAGTVTILSGEIVFGGSFAQTGGTTNLNGGNIQFGQAASFTGGALIGAGTITGSLANAGAAIRPGGSGAAGTLNLTGDYTQGSGGILDVEIGGAAAGTEYDQLAVAGSASLDGALNATLINGFTPATGSVFTVLTSASRIGIFASVNASAPLLANYTPTDVQLVAPAPLPPLIVTTALDVADPNDGVTSLREALLFANSNPGPDIVTFAIPGAGVHNIALTAPLPAITDALVIDGYSQPGASPNTLASGSDAVLLVQLSNGGGITNGLVIASPGVTIAGLVVTGFGDVAGAGVLVQSAGSGAVIIGNFIGLDPSGASAGNARGIVIENASGVIAGGATAGERNVISGNAAEGILISGSGATGNLVQGNYLGADLSGAAALANGSGVGIRLGSSGNLIGGMGAGEGNVIAFNASAGVVVSDLSRGNLVLGNSIHDNAALGIDLGGDGFTPNDAGDADTGANDLINFPVITNAVATTNGTLVSGTVTVATTGLVRLEFFTADAGGEGETFLGSMDVNAVAGTPVTFNTTLAGAVSPGGQIVATASDPGQAGAGTSEFSTPAGVVAPVFISVSDAIVAEGDTGARQLVFTFSLDQASPFPVTVDFTTAPFSSDARSATAGVDYQALAGTVTFAAGTLIQTRAITVNGDTLLEPRERFNVLLSNPSNALLGDDTGEGIIQDDDHHLIAAASGKGNTFTVYAAGPAGESELATVRAFGKNFKGGVRVAVGDVNGDGVDDFIAGGGSSSGARVKVFDGATITAAAPALLANFSAFGAYRGGVFVAAGDVNGDGAADIIVSPSAGSVNKVRVFDGVTGELISDFRPFGRGSAGVRVAAGDIDGDGRADIIAGTGRGSSISVFDGQTGLPLAGSESAFRAFGGQFRGGVFVSAGDIDFDGIDDIIAGAGSKSATVRVFTSGSPEAPQSFEAYGRNLSGVRVAAIDVNSDGIADIITAKGTGADTRVTAFDGAGGDPFFDFKVEGPKKKGVYVG